MPNITITEQDFAQLVSGQSVERDGVWILLEDFGFDRMLLILDQAIDRLQARQGGRLLDFSIRPVRDNGS